MPVILANLLHFVMMQHHQAGNRMRQMWQAAFLVECFAIPPAD